MLRAMVQWIFFGNFFIAFCAVLLVNETGWHFYNHSFSVAFNVFVFCATLCSYSLHTYLANNEANTPASVFVRNHRWLYLLLFCSSAVYCLYFIYRKPELWTSITILAGLTFLYTAPKIDREPFKKLQLIAIGKTIYLALVWTLVTVWLPFRYGRALTGAAHAVYFAHKFFFLLTISIIFDYRYKTMDQAQGIRSLVTYMSNRNVERWLILTLLLFTIAGGSLAFFHFPFHSIMALLFPVLFIYPVFIKSKQTRDEIFYLLCVDGLLIIPALLLLLMGWVAIF